ncbi:hypothetical protein [Dinghuibacter silviterrae]|uniref:Uncharacterized protein n=1 Tax=Dinghuibacter silviterrae TaxID=1539049 RepID=A0A4R8DJJ8_9BACT|nr:hypothetical protein [Dinghuibacter silviterrae]TDW97356.1 hypothetical protein EDB95_5203 [Dinghuibacter silviterrae]
MTRLLSFCLILLSCTVARAQSSGSFVVGGSINNYYPVAFQDGAWSGNIATELQIGRSYIHQDVNWRGAVIAKFRFHSNNWGNAANFIDADVRTATTGTITSFVGGWQDVSFTNASTQIVIWLKGGTTTYYYNANAAVNPVVYDGVANALPFTPSGGSALTYKTAADSYVSTQGRSSAGNLELTSNLMINGGGSYGQMDIYSDLNAGYQFVAGGSFSGTAWAGKMIINYANYKGNNARFTIDSLGNVGIGTVTPQSLLAVAGTITAKQVTVTQTGWSDFVFSPAYHLPSLDSVAAYATLHHHLPGVPSETELDKNGLDLGAMQKLQMQKIEELTLYCAQLARENKALRNEINKLKKSH